MRKAAFCIWEQPGKHRCIALEYIACYLDCLMLMNMLMVDLL